MPGSSANAAGQVAPLPFWEVFTAEGTLGAVVRVRFRERARKTALKGVLGRKPEAPGEIVRYEAHYRRAAGLSGYSTLGSARFRDRGCPGELGRGKSVVASGRSRRGSTRSSKPSDPWPDEARLAASRKGRGHRAGDASAEPVRVRKVRWRARGTRHCRSQQAACGPSAPANSRLVSWV